MSVMDEIYAAAIAEAREIIGRGPTLQEVPLPQKPHKPLDRAALIAAAVRANRQAHRDFWKQTRPEAESTYNELEQFVQSAVVDAVLKEVGLDDGRDAGGLSPAKIEGLLEEGRRSVLK